MPLGPASPSIAVEAPGCTSNTSKTCIHSTGFSICIQDPLHPLYRLRPLQRLYLLQHQHPKMTAKSKKK